MARPKINEEKKKWKRYVFKVSNEEDEVLLKILKESNYKNPAELLRDLVFNQRYTVVSTDNEMYEIRLQLLNEVRRIGNNFNQLLKHYNQIKKENFTREDIDYLLFLLKNIDKTYSNINENFKK